MYVRHFLHGERSFLASCLSEATSSLSDDAKRSYLSDGLSEAHSSPSDDAQRRSESSVSDGEECAIAQTECKEDAARQVGGKEASLLFFGCVMVFIRCTSRDVLIRMNTSSE